MLNPFSSDLRGKQRAKPVPPKSNRLVADLDAALMQKIFDIPKRKWIAHIRHNRQADNLRARLEVLEYVEFGHDWTLRNHPTLHKPVSSDTANLHAHSLLMGTLLGWSHFELVNVNFATMSFSVIGLSDHLLALLAFSTMSHQH